MAALPRELSAKYREDHAYIAIKDDLPTVLAKVLNTIDDKVHELLQTGEEDLTNDLKGVTRHILALKHSLETDMTLKLLADNEDNTKFWNERYQRDVDATGTPPSWFKTQWLYAECYCYRLIHDAFAQSEHFKDFDPFEKLKQKALTDSFDAIVALLSHLADELATIGDVNDMDALERMFVQLLEVGTWGNKCDLSLSPSLQGKQTVDPIGQAETLRPNILVNHTGAVWKEITAANAKRPNNVRIDFILDNAGYEFFTDLCLVEFLLGRKLAHKITLRGKAKPWFISDMTPRDFKWILERLDTEAKSGKNELLLAFVRRVRQHLETGALTFVTDMFWTLPHTFTNMPTVAPGLYGDLKNCDLVVIKGDLNYRKLVGELYWHSTTPFEIAVGAFHPCPFCALRTVKCEVQVGLREGQAEELQRVNPNWNLSSDYSVIQFHAGVDV